MKMWHAGNNVELKEGPVRFVVVDHAADRDGQMAPDALVPMVAMITPAV